MTLVKIDRSSVRKNPNYGVKIEYNIPVGATGIFSPYDCRKYFYEYENQICEHCKELLCENDRCDYTDFFRCSLCNKITELKFEYLYEQELEELSKS